MREKVMIIAGPTASGKKQVAFEAARLFDGEIVSADSRKVYRGLDIGTAKPSADARARMPHHCIDIADPSGPFSAGDWTEVADRAVSGILGRGRLPIISGGTGFYIRAFADGLSAGIEPAPGVREALEGELARLGPEGMHRLLASVDLARASELSPNDTFRVMRALEIHRSTGLTFTEVRRQAPPRGRDYEYLRIGIFRARGDLYERCDRRVEAMISAGLEREVLALLEAGIPRGAQALDTVGYREWFGYFDGLLTREETIALIQRNTRRYAKRQLTWFRAQQGFSWYDPGSPGELDLLRDRIGAWLRATN